MINSNEIIIDNSSKDFSRLVINKKVIQIGKFFDIVQCVNNLQSVLIANNISYDIKIIEKEDKK